ncbi:hypothetical protein VC83_08057 [Pseudogymnoascus destructans]|uniref:Uncharacterized protein n=2 Tax=Pseudogymnoascus destructans TaxID=655981 RepID=L8G4J3_PSED2|nr:uncharacterized protein VC83_08057 [Pseudogymnoascus destructans]ELR08185.1 hypothetical protein GMDG_02997 [Pseudogymnoascus destructans 20631-21]OAF55867.1 hypothetical protein VC83_08057 [Pseudogymnoascus destructans]
MRAARWELYRLEQAQLERARLEHLRLEQYWLEYARLEQAWQEEGFIMLPTLPNNEPDKHRTLRHYHHEPMKWIHGSPHANYSEGKYHNPRYITPDTTRQAQKTVFSSSKSLMPSLLEQAGTRARYGFEIMAF